MYQSKAYPNPGALSQRLELIVEAQDVDNLGHLNNVAYVAYLERGRRSYVLEQSISREPGGVVCDARVTNVIMDLDCRTVVDIPCTLGRLF